MAAYEAHKSPASVAMDLTMKKVVVGLAAKRMIRHTMRDIESGRRQYPEITLRKELKHFIVVKHKLMFSPG